MIPLRFYLARTLRDEATLALLSVPQTGLLATAGGKQVALVGNARALSAQGHGAAIDAAGLVVRINRAPMTAAESHGTRTDWLALAVRLPESDRRRLDPARILWMSPKRKRLDWASARSPGFYLHPLADFHALARRLGAPPSTGIMAIDLLLRAPLKSLGLYGFDFFASKSLSGSRSAAQVPHDFAAEAAWVRARAATDPRLRLN
ncbi:MULTISPECIES: glycosyltransferase family 29 protein [unclassified Paracoccus (in: a-proteobacteria)]|uniref:glycosyltransferase family 29 protein n=1 Tax=unclassified Paracoccus (in: a-proteobacteria) TaxID=2688777 RepID=UPI001601ACB2|nr:MULTISPECIES: glycosyltransferase family 29 protein [unclassified Paracoccus (in: a-proteobacteria)]MBB1492064.1 glycosyltransferase family 29 protein [Paracoccus sp. MC1854]MBB1497950.1 glycosyltransferase family 29 protein [Paracoccus sp. MC1862]QQO44335.1 glycosyltransferase family 29 protein [Paracoccus sp. MC1862]